MENLLVTHHAHDRVTERGISQAQVYAVLKNPYDVRPSEMSPRPLAAGGPYRRDARGLATTRRGIPMVAKTLPGGTFTMAEDLTVTRMGYGAMQLAGPGVFGPPKDRDAAIAVLREAIELGITHIDTSDYYGPHVTNQIIKEALHPYPDSLHIVTKVGALRDAEGGWPQALAPEQLRQAVYDNPATTRALARLTQPLLDEHAKSVAVAAESAAPIRPYPESRG